MAIGRDSYLATLSKPLQPIQSPININENTEMLKKILNEKTEVDFMNMMMDSNNANSISSTMNSIGSGGSNGGLLSQQQQQLQQSRIDSFTSMSVQDINDLLLRNRDGLHIYAPRFQENCINGKVFLTLTEKDLKEELHIENIFHRRAILLLRK